MHNQNKVFFKGGGSSVAPARMALPTRVTERAGKTSDGNQPESQQSIARLCQAGPGHTADTSIVLLLSLKLTQPHQHQVCLHCV